MIVLNNMAFDTGDIILNNKIHEYINEQLLSIVECEIQFLKDDDWSQEYLECFFPRTFLEDNPQRAKQIILDLFDMLSSKAVRPYIKPIYQYALFNIIQAYIDIQNNLDDTDCEEINNDLKSEIITTMTKNNFDIDDINLLINVLNDLNAISECFFEDFDFEQEFVDLVTSSYIRGECLDYLLGIDLNKYVDIMSRDLRDTYLKMRQKSNIDNLTDSIIIEINSAIQQIQNRAIEYCTLQESQISDKIEEMLKRVLYTNDKIEVTREAPMGLSLITLGEADIYLYRQVNGFENIAIIENKLFNKNFNEMGQLFGYLNHTFKFGVTITINKYRSIEYVENGIINALESYQEKGINITNIYKSDIYNNLIISNHTLPERPLLKMPVYHFILNLNVSDRKKVAKTSRKLQSKNIPL